MAIGLDGQSYLDVQINGKKVPLEHMRFSSILISSHMLYHQPMGELKFTDPHNIISKVLTISDGALVTINMGRTSERVWSYSMRVFDVNTSRTDDGTVYAISLVDVMDVWRNTPCLASFEGTSNDCLKAYALKCGMKFLGTPTADAQVWLPLANTYCRTARKVASLGYADDLSCMLLGVTITGQLRYVNLAAIDFKTRVPHFTHGSEDGILVTDHRFLSSSGAANQGGGYKTTSHQKSTLTGQQAVHNKAKTKRVSNKLNRNTDVAAAAGAGRVDMRPIDAGNNHQFALKASYQNRRIKQLLSTSLAILTPFDPDIELFDPVAFSSYTSDRHSGIASKDERVSGYYVVAGKSVFIGPDLLYLERYQLIREGHNADTTKKVT